MLEKNPIPTVADGALFKSRTNTKFFPSLSCVVLSRPNVPPVSVLNKMFPDLPQKTAETLTLIEYESLKEESRQALQDRHLALNNSAAARLTEVIL